MPRLAIAKDFLGEYSKLEKKVQSAVEAAIGKFERHTHAGLHLERILGSRDDRIRTIRVDAFGRGVVLAPESGDTRARDRLYVSYSGPPCGRRTRLDEERETGIREFEARVASAPLPSWREIELGYGFHETRQGVRFTSARRRGPTCWTSCWR